MTKIVINGEVVDAPADVEIGDAILALIDAGLDEDAHHWDSSWREINTSNLECYLRTPDLQSRVLAYIRPALEERIQRALNEILEEIKRHE